MEKYPGIQKELRLRVSKTLLEDQLIHWLKIILSVEHIYTI